MHVTEVFVEVGAQPVEIDDVAAIQVKTDFYLKLKNFICWTTETFVFENLFSISF